MLFYQLRLQRQFNSVNQSNFINLFENINQHSHMILNSVSKFLFNTRLVQPKQIFMIIKQFKQNITQIKYSYSSSQTFSSQQSSYTQRAYTPSYMSKLLIEDLPTQSYQMILHQISLYSSKLLPFDYDYFCQSLKRLIPHQQKLSLNEIVMLFDLAIEYKIDNLILQTHFQNQLYCRVYLSFKKQLSLYDEAVQTQLKQTYSTLEAGSGDHFQVIDQKFKEFLQEDNSNSNSNNQNQSTQQSSQKSKKSRHKNSVRLNNNSSVNKPIYKAAQRKNKANNISSQTLNKITQIFLDINSRNIQFNNLLLQINSIRLDENTIKRDSIQELKPQFLLTYTRLTINLLQLYMTQYQSGLQQSTKIIPAKYTHRSVKHIYKLQAFYYYEVAKLIQEKKLLSKASNQQMEKFLQIISGFPIRRRSFRKSIGQVFIQQIKKRGIQGDKLMKFFQLSKYDNRILQYFETKINEGKQLPSTQQIKQKASSQSIDTNLLSKPLIPEIVDKNSSQIQGLFKMPKQLFRKVTKKKSKQKNSNFIKQNFQQIDLTQQSQDILATNTSSQNKGNSLNQKQEFTK